MRILLWHGYLLGARARTSTRGRSRASGPRRPRRRVFCQEPEPGAVRPRRREVVRPDARHALPVSCSTATRGSSRACSRTCPPRSASATSRERGRAARAACRPTSSSPTTSCWAGRSAARRARRSPSRRTAPSSSTRCAATPSSGVGGGVARARGAVFVGSSTSARCSRTSSGHVEHVHEVPPGVDVDEFVAEPRDEALAELLDECRADPPNPGNANERLPDEGNAERLARVPRRRRADRPLLREAALQQGRSPAARGAARARRAGGDRRLRRLPRASSSGSRRRGRCSPARSSTATSST